MVNATMFASQLMNGLVLGFLFVLIAVGMSIIFGMLGLVNFAHGAFFALGAYLALIFEETLHIDPLVSIPLVMAVLFCVGYVYQRLLIQRAVDRVLSDHGRGAFPDFRAEGFVAACQRLKEEPERCYLLGGGVAAYIVPAASWNDKVDLLPESALPSSRVFCMVGTNRSDYEVAAGLSRTFVGHGSDGDQNYAGREHHGLDERRQCFPGVCHCP